MYRQLQPVLGALGAIVGTFFFLVLLTTVTFPLVGDKFTWREVSPVILLCVLAIVGSTFMLALGFKATHPWAYRACFIMGAMWGAGLSLILLADSDTKNTERRVRESQERLAQSKRQLAEEQARRKDMDADMDRFMIDTYRQSVEYDAQDLKWAEEDLASQRRLFPLGAGVAVLGFLSCVGFVLTFLFNRRPTVIPVEDDYDSRRADSSPYRRPHGHASTPRIDIVTPLSDSEEMK